MRITSIACSSTWWRIPGTISWICSVFLQFSNVDWIASPFEPRHFTGKVLEFRYSPESNGGRFSILTDGPVSINKPFLVRPSGKFGHRIVIELVPEAYPGQRLLTQREN